MKIKIQDIKDSVTREHTEHNNFRTMLLTEGSAILMDDVVDKIIAKCLAVNKISEP